MSISFYLLLCMIFMSFQAWHSKSLHLADIQFQKKFQDPIKGNMAKMVISWDDRAIESMKLFGNSNAAEERESVKFKRQKRKRFKKLEEFENVSWRVPEDDHSKVEGNNDVFSSDYEHARTHPPSHN